MIFGVIPPVIEIPDASSPIVRIEAMIKLPPLDSAQKYWLHQAAINATQTTQGYTPKVIFDTLSPGYGLNIKVLPDYLRVGYAVPPQNLQSGLRMMNSFLTEPEFEERNISSVPLPEAKSGWERFLVTHQLQPYRFRIEDLKNMWRHVVTPQNTVIGVGGAFRSGSANEMFSEMGLQWSVVSPIRTAPRPFAPRPEAPQKQGFLMLSAPVKRAQAVHLVAATLLGGGKESPLWKVAREELALSYRQEAFLIPVASGWEFRIAIGSDAEGVKQSELLRKNLLSAVEKLDPADLKRAQTSLRSALIDGLGEVPIEYGADAFSGALYWQLKEGKAWMPADMNGQVQEVTLDQAKKYLQELLSQNSFLEV